MWDDISASVDKELTPRGSRDPDPDMIWLPGNESYVDHLLPWLVRSNTQLAAEGDQRAGDRLGAFLDRCLKEEASRRVVESRFSEELALRFASSGDLAQARAYCETAKAAFLRDWSAASASSGRPRKRLLQQLIRIMEMQEYVSAASGPDPAASAAALLRRWQSRYPSAHENLAFWESLITRRQLYVDRLAGHLTEADAARAQKLQHSARLRLVEAALAQVNVTAAEAHLKRLEHQLPSLRQGDAVSGSDLHTEYRLLWLHADLLQAGGSEDLLRTPAGPAEPLLSLLDDSQLDRESSTAQSAVSLALHRLSATMESSRDTSLAAEACLEAARFCARHLETAAAGDESALAVRLRGSFVAGTLRAMATGWTEAADWLPRLLQLADEHADAARAFEHQRTAVPSWMYLGWLPQLLSYCASAGAGVAVRPLLLALAEQYPQAVIYPLMVCRADTEPRPPEMEACLQRADALLGSCRLPTLLLARCARELDTLCREDGSGIGAAAAPNIERAVKAMLDSPVETRLSQYSSWLATFQDVEQLERLELPGQYSGRRRPTPERHVHVANFGQQVRVLASLKRPVLLTARGDDAREYRYLVKSGDDLRTDQRLQQLFDIMNGSLAADPRTAARHLTIRTYKVLPMKPTLGVIEWIDNTETLHQFLASASPGFERRCEEARRLHVAQMQQHATSDKPPALHGAYACHAPRQTVERDLRAREKVVGGGDAGSGRALLREALFNLSRDPEAFLRLRTNLAVSHALLSAAGWLLGVGDRHLSNFLVSLDDGTLIGIDFGLAFGSATQLPVPELVPFRLTPQLAGVTSPLGPAGLTRQTLLHALQALRSSHQLLAATLEVFVREPTVNWAEHVRKGAAAARRDCQSVKEYARRCVRLARRCLEGGHPSAMVCELLAGSSLPAQQGQAWAAVARGRPGLDPRADLPDDGLTVQQQVTCLMDLATDPYVLGLAYFGWEAHV
ncbi:DNA-dependent protein kinase catalytic subunit-like [Pollicipes pollicipes]|uniref:DNA-dependent protein kinase catalytic subunit-like n=1 Tax=Pollicipes pollicipes TaxID=41117 RepID=UPI0018856B2A|nr:DNA-dependent protein kinase catalytic subunit-like [Pollicipes pollicipes]